jgi:transposase-like protein
MPKAIDVQAVASSVYWREEDARAVVAAWRASGESVSAFARRHGVERRRVARWIRRLEAMAAPHFHPVRVTGAVDPEPLAAAIEIELASGERIRLPPGFDADDLRRLFSVLRASSSC